MNNEIWKDIVGYEGLYQVSDMGRVRSLDRKCWNGVGWFIKKGRILKERIDRGYKIVNLCKNGRAINKKVHRLVLTAFVPIENSDELEVDHIDTNPSNNNLCNLRWATRTENANNELTKKHMSESSLGRKLSEDAKKKLSEFNRGKKLSEEHKKKLSENSSKSKAVICVETGEIFKSITEASKSKNLKRSNISKCCIGERKTCGGFHWRYLEEEVV